MYGLVEIQLHSFSARLTSFSLSSGIETQGVSSYITELRRIVNVTAVIKSVSEINPELVLFK